MKSTPVPKEPEQRELIDRLAKCPDEELVANLSLFTEWNFDKGDVSCWLEVLNRFDKILEQIIESFPQLRLGIPATLTPDSLPSRELHISEAPFPLDLIDKILKATDLILSHCHNSQLYPSGKHLSILLNSDQPVVLWGVCRVMVCLVKKAAAAGSVSAPDVQRKLVCLVHGWGGREEGLGFLAVARGDSSVLPAQGASLHFEFTSANDGGERIVVHVPELSVYGNQPYTVFQKIIELYSVPFEVRFALFQRILIALAFSDISLRRSHLRVRLLALSVLAHLSPEGEYMLSVFATNPDIILELVDLAGSDNRVPAEVRAQSWRCLQALSVEKKRLIQILTLMGANDQSRLLQTILRRCAATVTAVHQSKTAPSGTEIDEATAHALKDVELFPLMIVEALLGFLSMCVTSGQSAAAITTGGAIPSLLQIAAVEDESMLTAVSQTLRVLELLGERATNALPLIRQLHGFELVTRRLELETALLESGTPYPSLHKMLLRALLRALMSIVAPDGTQRLRDIFSTSIPAIFTTLYKHSAVIGGGGVSFCDQILAMLIQNEPMSMNAILETPVIETWSSCLIDNYPVHQMALIGVPTLLSALALRPEGLALVREKRLLFALVSKFANPEYLPAFHNDGAAILGTGLEELMRHVPDLRGAFAEAVADVLDSIRRLDTSRTEARALLDSAAVVSQSKEDEKAVMSLVTYVCRMIEQAVKRKETVRALADAGVLERLLDLHTLQNSPSPFTSSNASPSVSYCFRALVGEDPARMMNLIAEKALSALARLPPLPEVIERVQKGLPPLTEDGQKALAGVTFFTGILSVAVRASSAVEWGNSKFAVVFEYLASCQRALLVEVLRARSKLEAERAASATVTATPAADDMVIQDVVSPIAETPEPMMDDTVNPQMSAELHASRRPEDVPPPAVVDKSLPMDLQLFQGTCTAVSHLFTVLARSISLQQRRREERNQPVTPYAMGLGQLSVRELITSLQKSIIDPNLRCLYLASVFDDIRSFLFDQRRERAPQTNVITLSLFHQAGGFQTINETLLWLVEQTDSPSRVDALTKGLQLVHRVLSMADIFSGALNGVVLFPQAQAFSPTRFLQSIAVQLSKGVLPIWQSPIVTSFSVALLNALLSVMQRFADVSQVLQRQAEQRENQPADQGRVSTMFGDLPVMMNDAFGIQLPPGMRLFMGDNSRARLPQRRPVIDTAVVEQLVSMGFPRAHAEEALRQTGVASAEVACEWLLMNPDPDITAPEETTEEDGAEGADDEEAGTGDEEAELMRAMALSMGTDEKTEPKEEPVPEEIPSLDEAALFADVERVAITILQASPATSTAVAELLSVVATRLVDKRALIVEAVVPVAFNSEMASELQIAGMQALNFILGKVVECRPTAVARGVIESSIQASAAQANRTICLALIDTLMQVPLASDGSLCVAGVQGDKTLLPSELPLLASETQQIEIMRLCAQLLADTELSFPDAEKIFVICSRLSRLPAHAEEMVKQGFAKQVVAVLLRADAPSKCIPARVLIRRLVEDREALQVSVEAEVRAVFTANEQRVSRMDGKTLLRGLSGPLYRSPAVVFSAASNCCTIPPERPNQIILKSTASPDTSAAPGTGPTTTATTAATTTTTTTTTSSSLGHGDSEVERYSTFLNCSNHFRKRKGDLLLTVVQTLVQSLSEVQDLNQEKSQKLCAALLQLLLDVVGAHPAAVTTLLRASQKAIGTPHKSAQKHHESAFLDTILRSVLPHVVGLAQTAAQSASASLPSEIMRLSTRLLVALCVRHDGRRRVVHSLVALLQETTTLTGDAHLRALHAVAAVLLDISTSKVLRSHGARAAPTKSDLDQLLADSNVSTLLLATLDVLDLNHPRAPQVASEVLKALDGLLRSLPQPSAPATEVNAPGVSATPSHRRHHHHRARDSQHDVASADDDDAMRQLMVTTESERNPRRDVTLEMEVDSSQAGNLPGLVQTLLDNFAAHGGADGDALQIIETGDDDDEDDEDDGDDDDVLGADGDDGGDEDAMIEDGGMMDVLPSDDSNSENEEDGSENEDEIDSDNEGGSEGSGDDGTDVEEDTMDGSDGDSDGSSAPDSDDEAAAEALEDVLQADTMSDGSVEDDEEAVDLDAEMDGDQWTRLAQRVADDDGGDGEGWIRATGADDETRDLPVDITDRIRTMLGMPEGGARMGFTSDSRKRNTMHRWTDDGNPLPSQFARFCLRYESQLVNAIREAVGLPSVEALNTSVASPSMQLNVSDIPDTTPASTGRRSHGTPASAEMSFETPLVPQPILLSPTSLPQTPISAPRRTTPVQQVTAPSTPPTLAETIARAAADALASVRSSATPPVSTPVVPERTPSSTPLGPPPPRALTAPVADTPASLFPPGLDPTFLEALPPELRAEVITSEASARGGEISEDVGVSAEFLAALPRELQMEVLEQQARERRLREESLQSRARGAAPTDIDNASFIASLAPELREEVLLTADDTVLASLPEALQAEAHALRQRTVRQQAFRQSFFGVGAPSRTAPVATPPRAEAERSGPVVAAIGENGVRALVRLVRLGQQLSRSYLPKVLLLLCAVPETRKWVIEQLLELVCLPTDDTDSGHTAVSTTPTSTPSGDLESALKVSAAPASVFGTAVSGMRSWSGVPPQVARRVLDTLSFICQHQSKVSAEILGLATVEKPSPAVVQSESESKNSEQTVQETSDSAPSAGLVPTSVKDTDITPVNPIAASTPICRIMNLMNNKLYAHSSAHLEQLLQLLSVIFGFRQDRVFADASLILPVPVLPPSTLEVFVNVLKRPDLTPPPAERCSRTIMYRNIPADVFIELIIRLASNPHNGGVLMRCLVAAVREALPGVTARLRKISSSVSWTASEFDHALLRLLRTISTFLLDVGQPEQKLVKEVCDELETMWDILSECFAKLPTNRVDVAGALLPLIAVFFETVSLQKDLSSQTVTRVASAQSLHSLSDESKFSVFVNQHRQLLNAVVRQNTNLLDGAFGVLVRVKGALEFDNKRAWFRSQIRKRRDRNIPDLRINVRRHRVFEDSFHQFRARSSDELKGKLVVSFDREEGIDAGGLTREWFVILAREMFNPGYALFSCSAESKTFQPNRTSYVNPEHISYFRFIGQVIGKAVMDGHMLDAHFTRAFYKHILGISITPSDLAAADPDYYKQLEWMLNNDITGVLELTFSAEIDDFGKRRTIELMPGGESIAVTNSNKQQYVQLMCELRMTTSIRTQIDAFLHGFNDLVPRDLISAFTEQELELLISGLPEIDIHDLRVNTEYTGFTPSEPVITWFWSVMENFSQEQRAHFLQFVTGTSKVPLDGFKSLQGMSGLQKFNIHKAYGGDDRLPTAHTCFNQLDLPDYSSRELLLERLLFAITEGSTGFGFG